ncbi:MAG TPA: adenylate/guanylate cyclase domain-containing protein, partial [Armatimonadota bacterium]|nr:adenylate/guanylate cyclase domain-containing protein [Armatimonadota bacterium]
MGATTEETVLNAQQLKDLQVAHVLYMDLVDYSSLPLEQHPQLLAQLQDIVRSTAEFQCASERGELLCLPSGDGMALAFFQDPVAPIRCALELAAVLKQQPRIKLRMGIHSGPVYRLADINANSSIAGSGINTAQRVMDCGDAGHILLSQASAAVLIQMGRWQNALHDVGYCQVKHGERLHLYNFWTDSLGNPELPARLTNRATVAALLSDLTTNQDAVPAREIENHYALLLGTTNERQIFQCGAAFLAVQAEYATQRVPDLALTAFARAPLLTAIQTLIGDKGLSGTLPGATPPVVAPGTAMFIKALNELPQRHLSAWATRLHSQQSTLLEIPERLRNSLERSSRELLTQATERLAQGIIATGTERASCYQAAMSALQQGLQNRATRRDYIVWFQIGWLEWKANGNLAAAEEAFARSVRLGSVNRDGYYRESLRHLAYLHYLCGNSS